MISLRLETPPTFALDLSGLIPERLQTLTLDQIQRLPLQHGRDTLTVGELFKVKGKPEESLEIINVTKNCHRLGAQMTSGKLSVQGVCGAELGREMRGGSLVMNGDAGDYTGATMRGGTLEINGNAGDFVGAPIGGATTGMKGGSIVITKNAGKRLGDRLRRGLIVVGGNVDIAAASQLIAGTVVVLGEYGAELGNGMRRGTLLARNQAQAIPANFVLTGVYSLPYVTLLTAHIARLCPKYKSRLRAFNKIERWVGDRGCGGLGELLIARAA